MKEQGDDAVSEVQQLWEQLRQKDAQILMLQKKLGHFRNWVCSLHAKVQATNPQAIKNSRRLYVGGIPENTSEVRQTAIAQSYPAFAADLLAESLHAAARSYRVPCHQP